MSETLSFHPGVEAKISIPGTLDFGRPFRPQVERMIETAGQALQKADEICLPGQGVAAILALPAIEMISGLPTMTLYGFGQEVKKVGKLNLADYRHNEVRPRRIEVSDGDAFAGYTILDGAGRGLEEFQMAELAKTLDTTVGNIRIVDVSMGHINPANPTEGLADRLIASGLTKVDWTSGRIIFVPPGFGPLAAVIATTIYGFSEVWPRTVRFNREADGQFHMAEVVDPQAMRQWGTTLVGSWQKADVVTVGRSDLEEALKHIEAAGMYFPSEVFERLADAIGYG